MQKAKKQLVVGVLGQVALACAVWQSGALAGKSPYPRMAPLAQYLMPEDAEMALARSAAPQAISAGAAVMVLGRAGYRSEGKGKNGFVCLVERSWGAATGDREFWNPKVRGPLCFNPPAARYRAAHLSNEDEIAVGREVGRGARPEARSGVPQREAAAARACRNVLHAV